MKEKIQAFLCKNDNWKKFIDAKPSELKEAKILSVNVTTFLHEGEKVSFDVSLVHTIKGNGQKQSYKSGVGSLYKNGNIKEIVEYPTKSG
jgi:hypothetical protein